MANNAQHGEKKENPSVIPFKSAFWLVIILVGLYIASVNFIAAESGGEGSEKKEATEMKAKGEKTEVKATEPAKAEEKKEAAPKAEEKKEEEKKPE